MKGSVVPEPMSCARCGTEWRAWYARCPKCGGTQRTPSRNAAATLSEVEDQVPPEQVPRRFESEARDDYDASYLLGLASPGSVRHVVLMDVRLSFAAVFELVFKFWLAIVLLNVLLIAAFVIGLAVFGVTVGSLID